MQTTEQPRRYKLELTEDEMMALTRAVWNGGRSGPADELWADWPRDLRDRVVAEPLENV